MEKTELHTITELVDSLNRVLGTSGISDELRVVLEQTLMVLVKQIHKVYSLEEI